MAVQETVEPAAVSKSRLTHDTVWLVGISLAFWLVLLPFSSYATLLPQIQAEWQTSYATSALIFSAHFVGFALGALFIVPLTDRWATERVMLAGMALLVVANLLFPMLAKGVWSAILLRVLAGVGHVAAYNPAIRAVSDRFARGRGSAVGLFVGAGFAGTTLSYAVTGLFLGSEGDWQSAFWYTALLGLAGFVLALPLVLLPYFQRRTEAATPAASSAQRGRLDLSVLRERPVALVTAAYALHTAELYLARLWFPLLLAAALMVNGMEPGRAAVNGPVLAGTMFAMGSFGVVVGGFLSDKLGRTRAAMLIFATGGICSFAAGWLVGGPLVWLTIVGYAYGLLTAADSAIYLTSIIEVAPAGRVGSAQAVQSTVGFLLGAIVPIVAGGILDYAGENPWRWVLAFGLNGLLAVAGVVSLMWLARMTPVRAAPN